MTMLVLSFFSWWYGWGWRLVFNSFGPRLRGVMNGFSVVQLLGTLFAPWRRIITYPGASLEDKMRAKFDNLFSRIIGFVVRAGVLLAAVVTLLVVALLTGIEVVVWPLLPLAVPGCLIAGLTL
jgi:hypothetical protein